MNFNSVFDQTRVVLKHLAGWIPDEAVLNHCNKYGKVSKIIHPENKNDYWGKYSAGAKTGDRWIFMKIDNEMPRFTEIEGARVTLMYDGQKDNCSLCRQQGHDFRVCDRYNKCKKCNSINHKTEACKAFFLLPV